MGKKDAKNSNRSAEESIPSKTVDAAASLADNLGSMNVGGASTSTSPAGAVSVDEFNDMDDPLDGFEAQPSGIKDLSLKVRDHLVLCLSSAAF